LLGELIIFTHAGGSRDYKVDRVTQFPGVSPDTKPVAVDISSAVLP
jgi:hypothetical protein